jgi:hypothetical protein
MSTKIQYFCDRCDMETKEKCRNIVLTDNVSSYSLIIVGEMCPTCLEELKTIIAHWKLMETPDERRIR